MNQSAYLQRSSAQSLTSLASTAMDYRISVPLKGSSHGCISGQCRSAGGDEYCRVALKWPLIVPRDNITRILLTCSRMSKHNGGFV